MLNQLLMPWIQCRNQSIHRNISFAPPTPQTPFIDCDEEHTRNCLYNIMPGVGGGRMLPIQAIPKAKDENESTKNIGPGVKSSAFLRLQVFGPRNFAIATVHNAVYLKNGDAGHEGEVIATEQYEEGGDRQDQHGNCPRCRSYSIAE